MLRWISTHGNEIQALAAIAISVLTLVLIVLNIIYVRANWKAMRLMEADVRFRLKPIPHLGMAAVNSFAGPSCKRMYLVHIRAEHAPLRLVALSARFTTDAEQVRERWLSFNREIVQETPFETQLDIQQDQSFKSWRVTLYYRDLSGLLDYATNFNEQGFVSEERAVDRKAFFTRMRIWFGRQLIKVRMRFE
jgi:hypothetical protein